MPTVFTRIIAKELPSHMVWSDDVCVVFASIEPIRPGHLLIVPRDEVETYWDAPADTVSHMARVAQIISRAQLQAFDARKVGQIVAGFDVPHLHVHLIPLDDQGQLSLAHARPAGDAELAAACRKIRQALRSQGHTEHVCD